MTLSPTDLNTMRQALIDLQANIDESGPCDHPVNICVCGLRTTLTNLADLFHHLSYGQVGYRKQPEPTFDVADLAINMLRDMNNFRTRQLAIEHEALKEHRNA